MPVARITDHVQAGLALLLEQYKEKPRIEALLSSELKQIQALEDAIWSVIIGRLIDNAVGVQLEVLGKIVGQRRDGAEDEAYRARIRARIRANRSLGHPDDLIAVALLATALLPEQLTYTEQQPATFIVDLLGATDPSVAAVVRELLAFAKPPGVAFALFYSEFPESETFALAPGDDPIIDTARGFTDDDDPTTAPGGRWIESI